MTPQSQRPSKGRDGVLSSLNAVIGTLDLAGEVVGVSTSP